MKFIRYMVVLFLSISILSCSGIHPSAPSPEQAVIAYEPAAIPPPSPAPAATAYEPVASAYEPAGSAYEPAATAYEPAGSAYEPAATAYEPAATAYEPAATASPPESAVPASPSIRERVVLPSAPHARTSTAETLMPDKQLYEGRIAWNTPPTMMMGQSSTVELRVTLDPKMFAGLASRVLADGDTTAHSAELSKDLTATLESTEFEIKPASPNKQHVYLGRDAIWLWGISPKKPGDHTLILTIVSDLEGGLTNEPLLRKIFVKTIPEPPYGEKLVDFIIRNWDKLLALVLVPVGGWIFNTYRSRRRVS